MAGEWLALRYDHSRDRSQVTIRRHGILLSYIDW